MAYTIQIGSTQCHILSDGLHLIDGGGFFGLVPRMLWQGAITPDERNLIPTDARSLLIESDAGLILVDVGNGDKLSEKQRGFVGLDSRNERLIGDMRSVGFEPEDVDLVLFTHFHGDHIGGATRFATSSQTAVGSPDEIAPTFPNATYMGQRIDLAEASFPNERTHATYNAQNWQPIFDAGQFKVVDGPQRLAGSVRTETAPGHTASLQVVWVEDGGESLCFLGDACSWAVHMDRLAWVPAFDLDPMSSIETKRRLRHEALERDALLVFQHDSQVVTGKLTPGKRGPRVRQMITEDAWFDSTVSVESE